MTMNPQQFRFSALALVLGLALLVPVSVSAQQASAAAGKVLLVIGGASIERGQTSVAAQRGALLQPGDTLVTSLAGRMHVRMRDGAMIALKPDTRFTIDEYNLNDDDADQAGVSVDGARPDPTVASRNGNAVMTLLRGGFRTLTGLIGRRDKSAYRVKTPVATIGIRGTDYTAFFCGAGQCGGVEGLYLGVWDGGVEMTNDGGSQEYSAGEFGFVPNNNTRPGKSDASPLVAADSPPIVVEEDGEESSGDDDQDGGTQQQARTTSPSGDPEGGDLGPETRPVEPDPVFDDDEQPNNRSIAFRVSDTNNGDFAGNDAFSAIGQDANGNLQSFELADSQEPGFNEVYDIGTAVNVNQGTDPQTGIQWGRWSDGVATVTVDDGAENFDIDLTNNDLHYIFGPTLSQEPAFTLTGTAAYDLVGNTNPTDSMGNEGVLGSASLFVDFTNQSVDHSLALNINSQVWNASGTGNISNGNALFSGAYSSITVDGVTPTGSSGDFQGFFSPLDSSGLPGGAGLTYNLSDGSTDVTGSAAFRQQAGNGQ